MCASQVEHHCIQVSCRLRKDTHELCLKPHQVGLGTMINALLQRCWVRLPLKKRPSYLSETDLVKLKAK